jgi:UPF0271 protein
MVNLHINCDVGEEDESLHSKPLIELAEFISSANIACGFHAGSPSLISNSIDVCLNNNIEIGAHPSFLDRENFGRKAINTKKGEIYHDMLYQLGAFSELARSKEADIAHIKPHGALYNETAKNEQLCEEMIKAFYDFNPTIPVYGLPNSIHEVIAKKYGLGFVAEGFADRRYDTISTLLGREIKESIIYNPEDVIEQVSLLLNDKVMTWSRGLTTLHVETICVHGDNPNVLDILKALSRSFAIIKF